MFCQIAAGIDDDTWLFHLRRGDYSNWLRIVIKDDELATVARELEQRHDLAAADTRYSLCDAISCTLQFAGIVQWISDISKSIGERVSLVERLYFTRSWLIGSRLNKSSE